MANHIFTGSGVAIITPMKSDGSVNYDVLGQLLEFHVENGTDAIIACGTTGEAATLSEKEHCEVLSFVAEKITLQNVILRAVFQHTDEQTHIAHIYLESVLFGVAVQRQFGNGEVIAAGDDPCILDPLQASGIFCSCGAFSDNRILEFLIFLG